MIQGQSLTNRDFQGYPGLHKTLFQVKNQHNQTKEQYIKNRIDYLSSNEFLDVYLLSFFIST